MAFYGMGGSGKTYAMQQIAKSLAKRGALVVVYNPTGQTGWPARAIHARSADHLEQLLENQKYWRAHVFVDETSLLKRETRWTGKNQHRFLPVMLTVGRHRGMTFYMATVRPFQIPPDWRNNVNVCYCFRLAGSRDARSVWDDFENAELDGRPAHEFMRGLPDRHYIKFVRGKEPTRGRT